MGRHSRPFSEVAAGCCPGLERGGAGGPISQSDRGGDCELLPGTQSRVFRRESSCPVSSNACPQPLLLLHAVPLTRFPWPCPGPGCVSWVSVVPEHQHLLVRWPSCLSKAPFFIHYTDRQGASALFSAQRLSGKGGGQGLCLQTDR